MILDSSTLVDFLDPETEHHTAAREFIADRPDQSWFAPTLVLYELYRYRAQKTGADGVAELAESLEWLEPLAFTESSAREAAMIEAELMAAGTPINGMDVLIAGLTRATGRTLVTRDGDFGAIDGFDIEQY